MKDTRLSASLPPLGSVIVVKHSGVHSSGILREAVYWKQLKSIHDEYQPLVGRNAMCFNFAAHHMHRLQIGETPPIVKSSSISWHE